MSADSTKPVEGGNNGSGLNNSQPPKQPVSEPKGEGQDDKGIKKPTSTDTSNFIAKDKYEEDIKSRDGTISALQKKVDNLQNGLKSALGIEGQEQKSTDELISSLQNQITSLQNENKVAKDRKSVG